MIKCYDGSGLQEHIENLFGIRFLIECTIGSRLFEPHHEKTGLQGFQQTGLYNHRRWLEA